MNILVPVSWLAEYLETDLTPEELAALGSLHGPSFERIESIEGEPVHDIEITTNRVDAMSIKGLARELAAIVGDRAHPKKLTQENKLDWSLQTTELPLPKVTVQTDAVKKIVCVVLDGVHNQPSPAWLQKRLRQIGQNPHGIIIDMSNYVTHELGHPCHTFDYDKIMALGGEIIVKKAAAGKDFVTLDGQTHQTVGGEVVFENQKGEIIDLPAIKGTANTAIGEKTTRVLFWLENMDAPTVRQASMNHAIRTVAAILNEKNVDPCLMEEVLTLGTQLLQEHAGAKIASPVYTYADKSLQKPLPTIKFDLIRLRQYLGVEIPAARVEQILTALGFVITARQKTSWTVQVPTYRAHDVTMAADLIEEVARIYGYHRLPSNIDFKTVQIPPQEQFDFALENRLKHALVDNGLTEVYTYSMISEAQVSGDPQRWLRLINPLTEDKVYLRQSLIPSLVQVYEENQVDPAAVAGVFELANVYFPGQTRDRVDERLKLSLVTTLPYRRARGLVERLTRLANVQIKIDKTGKITSEARELGQIEQLPDDKIAVELDMTQVVAARRPVRIAGHTNQNPEIREDLTFVVPAEVSVGELIDKIAGVSELIVDVRLGEIYRDRDTFHLVYQKRDGALASSELLPLRRQIVAAAASCGCTLVGQLEGQNAA